MIIIIKRHSLTPTNHTSMGKFLIELQSFLGLLMISIYSGFMSIQLRRSVGQENWQKIVGIRVLTKSRIA